MNESNVRLLSTMTGEQIAEWCAKHGVAVHISGFTRPNGQTLPLIRVIEDELPCVDAGHIVRGLFHN